MWLPSHFNISVACICSLGIGVLSPITIIITGDVLNGGAGTSTFTSSTEELATQLQESGIDLLDMMRPLILKFVYFGIAILGGAYLAQSLWVFTSERLTRVCLFLSYFHPPTFLLCNLCRKSEKDMCAQSYAKILAGTTWLRRGH